MAHHREEPHTFVVPPGTRVQLDHVAARMGFASGTELVAAIAGGELELGPGFRLPQHQVEALFLACRALVDLGFEERVRALLELLVAHADLEAPVREGALAQLAASRTPWRLEIDAAIAERRPFLLSYLDAEGRSSQFAVRHARIRFRGKRSYLDVWTDEAAEGDPLPALAHNRTLRLDRIKSMYLLPLAGTWRDAPDELDVEVVFRGRLGKDYEAHEDDVGDVLAEDGATRHVTRRVTSAYWFLREALGWGAGAEVVGPPSMRELVCDQLAKAAEPYRA